MKMAKPHATRRGVLGVRASIASGLTALLSAILEYELTINKLQYRTTFDHLRRRYVQLHSRCLVVRWCCIQPLKFVCVDTPAVRRMDNLPRTRLEASIPITEHWAIRFRAIWLHDSCDLSLCRIAHLEICCFPFHKDSGINYRPSAKWRIATLDFMPRLDNFATFPVRPLSALNAQLSGGQRGAPFAPRWRSHAQHGAECWASERA